MATIDFNELPKEAKIKIFSYMAEENRQKVRIVSTKWNTFINDEFPLEIEVTNENFATVLLRGNAYKATIRDLTAEIIEHLSFPSKLRQLEAVGKVVTSNLLHILKNCRNIEMLGFTSLKEILTIESEETVELPKVVALQIKIRGEHQMFTLAEMMLIDWVTKRLEFATLKIVIIKGCSPAEMWAEHRYDSSQGFSENDSSMSTIYNLSREITAVSSAAQQSGNALHPIPGQRNLTRAVATSTETVGNSQSLSAQAHVDAPEVLVQIVDTASGSSQPPPGIGENGHLILTTAPSAASAAPTEASSNQDDNQSQANSESEYSYSRQSIFDRVLQRNAMASEDDTEDTGEVNGYRLEQNFSLLPTYYYNGGTSFTDTNQAAVSNSVFIKFLLKNCRTLTQLVVSARSDFICFGNLSPFLEDCKKIQFENLEYNFGRSIIYMEFMLLRSQTKLTKIRIQIIEDMLMPFLLAVNASSRTIQDIDVKIISFSEDRDPFQYQVFANCNSLLSFKILHFSSKQGLDALPVSIERLLMNGPLTLADLNTLATRLVNLKECNILLNVNMGIVDVDLYKKFLRLPNLRMLSFVQCEIDIEGIEALCKSLPGIAFSIDGPRKLNTLPDIQYVITTIPLNFNRALLR